MTSLIKVFNLWGEYQDVIHGASSVRSWVLNGYSKCEFTIPIDHPKATYQNLLFGNFIYVQHIPGETEAKLPPWVGVILPDQNWDDNAIHVTAYSAEALLAFRALPYFTLENIPISSAFSKIIEFANNASTRNTMQIKLGSVTEINSPYNDTLRTNAFDHLKKLIGSVDAYWRVVGTIASGSYALSLYAEFKPLDNTVQNLKLTPENTERTNPLLKIQGTIINDLFAYTDARTEADRKTYEAINKASFDLYGPFQANQVFTGVTDVAALQALAQNKVNQYPGAVMRFDRTATDVGGTFDYLRVGNVVEIDEPNVGFNPNGGRGVRAPVRIIGMTYNDTTEKVTLTLEVI